MNTPRLLISLLVMLVSCHTDPGIDLPFEGSRIVVKMLLSPDHPFSVRLDHTYPPTGESLFDTTFSDATVVVYENNQLIDTLRYTQTNNYESERNLKPRAGATYRLRITAPGYPDAESRDEVVPPAPDVAKATLDKPDSYVVRLVLQNRTSESRRYNLQLTGLYKGKGVQLFVEDLVRPDGIVDNCGFRRDNETFFYRDACALNQQLSIQFRSTLTGNVPDLSDPIKFYYPVHQSDQVRVRIRSVTNSYWDYYRTLPNTEGFEQAFLQPATRSGNIQGGYGIVAAYNEQVVLLPVTR